MIATFGHERIALIAGVGFGVICAHRRYEDGRSQ